nr:hypothetical protein [Tanacetum cinerariifolium]
MILKGNEKNNETLIALTPILSVEDLCCDGDIRMGDSTGVSASLDGEIFSGGKKCQESNIGDSDNTRDGGKIVAGIGDSLA